MIMKKNIAACIDDKDCGIDYTWNKIYESLHSIQTQQNRYKRVLARILPLAKEALNLCSEDFCEKVIMDYQKLQNIWASLA